MNSLNPSSPFSLDGEVALITGGGTGLGLAVAKCLVKAGARAVITGRRQDVLERAIGDIGSAAMVIPWDINELDSLPDLISDVLSKMGAITILVNNAGSHLKAPALETSNQQLKETLQTHVSASFALARESAKFMLPRKKGSILFVGSMASLFGIPYVSAYSAAKAAVVGVTRALATEWSGQGIRVNAIVPGWVDSGMAASILNEDPERKARILSRTPMQRMGSAEDIGWAAVYLSSPAARFVTGCTLVVDGGASIGF
jgi:gluconate 5-dehydrogenase